MDRLQPRSRPDDVRARTGPSSVAGITPMPSATRGVDTWNYRPDAGWSPEFNLLGYRVQATDGKLGKIKQVGQATNDSYLVVDTGPWIFGTKVMVPAGNATFIDYGEHRVYLNCTKADVLGAPEFDPKRYDHAAYREKLGEYYASRHMF
jgi:hypothetical protein